MPDEGLKPAESVAAAGRGVYRTPTNRQDSKARFATRFFPICCKMCQFWESEVDFAALTFPHSIVDINTGYVYLASLFAERVRTSCAAVSSLWSTSNGSLCCS